MKKLSNYGILAGVISGVMMFVIMISLSSEISTKRCKKYIIKHASYIVKDKHGYSIDTCIGLPYYTDISICMYSDSSYNVVFWGNRESFLWDFRLDKSFTVDIPYEKYKKHNVELDKQILFILKSK
jgi:hypothetical protein